MPEDQNGNNTVEEIQPSVIPTEEQTPEVEGELPEDVSERTREQFEKLKQHNKELQEQLKAKEQTPQTSVFDDFRVPETPAPVVAPPPASQFPGLNQNQVNDVYGQLVDKEGYIDQKILVDTLKQLQDQAQKAQQEAAKVRQEYERIQENEQVQRAHSKYPQLDPKSGSKFDPNFFNAVKNELIGQMIQGDKDLLKAADKVASWYKTENKSSQEQEIAQKKQDQVRQINAIGSSISRSAPVSTSDDAELIRRTRAGDISALAERLKKAGL